MGLHTTRNTTYSEILRKFTFEDWIAFVTSVPGGHRYIIDQITTCTSTLIKVCDGARTIDHTGFDSNDATRARTLLIHARIDGTIHPRKTMYWAKRLCRYRKQLESLGIEYPSVMFSRFSEARQC